MDNLIKEFLKEIGKKGHILTSFTINEAFFCIFLSFILNLIVAWVYRKTHKGISYSQSYTHTIIIMGTVVSIIMLIIGSNIARAFSLVGALSIIRFRSAVKDSKDVSYIFLAMAIGMATGTRFYLLAILTCFMMCSIILFLYWTDFGCINKQLSTLKIRINSNMDDFSFIETIFPDFLESFQLLLVESVRGGLLNELTYEVILSKNIKPSKFIKILKEKNDNNYVSLISNASRTTI